MNQRTLLFIEKLKVALSVDERFAKLRDLSAKIENDEEIARISRKMNEDGEAYSKARDHYGMQDERTIALQRILSEEKATLSAIPLVAEYEEAYREISGIYLSLNDILFGDFNARLRLGAKQ